MGPSEIDSESLQAVKSLKSKFEQLAVQTSPHRPGSSDFLAPSSPRPRAVSSSVVDAPASHLRTSSSSSDLRVPVKKAPPPPPPPRGSKTLNPSPIPSPSPSPLLRPVPIPPVKAEIKELGLGANVSNLKSKFAQSPTSSPSRMHSPRQSLVAFQPIQGEAKPVIPPRPSTLLGVTAPEGSQADSEDESSTETSPSSISLPAIPARRTNGETNSIHVLGTHFSDSSQTSYDSDAGLPPTRPTLPSIPPRPHALLGVPTTSSPEDAYTFSQDDGNARWTNGDKNSIRSLGAHFPDSSQTSYDSDASIPPPPRHHSRPTLPPDFKPSVPPRHNNLLGMTQTTSPESSQVFSREDGNVETSPPPPIPARRINGDNGSIRSLGSVSFESDVSLSSSRSNLMPPPPPPPRTRPSVSPEPPVASTSAPSFKFASPPPPLPIRRNTMATSDIVAPSPPPPLPVRANGANGMEPIVNERKPLGVSRLPPPPTRTIALGDKLPPARRPSTPSSDEESGDEEEPKVQTIDSMPDSSAASRWPPVLRFRDGYSEPKLHVHPHSGCVAMSGSYLVVGHNHHLKIYDLSLSEVPIHNLDTRVLGIKDSKVTCLEFRPCASEADRGFLLWAGTKEGHLFEIDIRAGVVRATKYAAHLHPITYLFRHARSMLSLDESGKVLIFSPDVGNLEDVSLLTTVPRVLRTTDKQDFVKMIDGKLWTAARVEHHGTAAAPTQRMPIIRIYDVFNPASTGRSVMPNEHVGPVTSATIIPSQPGVVYVGHEEGYVSMWELETDDGYPRCVEVMKVSTSDVLSLEGVNNRLWAGSRNGMISAYDVTQRPWLVTNCWNAHPGLPVMKLIVNYYAIVKVGRLCVASIGRDEQIRLWDGLLGLDWIDKELLKRETLFSTFRDLSVLVVSWNCDSARPDSLTGEPENFNLFNDILLSVDKAPDVIVFGFQEVIDLESRKMAAKNVLLGGKKKPDDGLSEKVTGAYKRWYDRLVLAVKAAMPRDIGYCVVHTENLVGLFSCIFVKNTERVTFDDVAVTTIKRGMGGRYGNKGGIVARFIVGDSSICFINCHLAAGQNGVRQRNADIAGMLEEKAVFSPSTNTLAYVRGGDGSMVLDHEFVILNGDMNYRIDYRRDLIMQAIRNEDYASLSQHDQLLREIKFNRGCRLRGFAEGTLNFAPTYKYDRHSNEYDTSEKRRLPAWCDRVLWRSRVASRIRQIHYRRYEANVSDHRPISAAFSVTMKKFDNEARERAKAELQVQWVDVQQQLLTAAMMFYVKQALL
ncbi:hypothetical protein NLJ89_g5412 [Agrocybe chaxingu]|uniref:Inositol polyphosphate-related phosphatase domain-containing protein n=1 Tax=Agrocybe chaxingu TaxID=84603 RepID=A0A9W8MTM0_9AGAR|nr:hypothetical protein NLJ89_g5412 [Agrocybe chaxingu]